MKRITSLIVFLISITSFSLMAQKKYEANWASIDSRPVPEWFEDSKFGIFIHWGLFSVPAWGPTKDVGVYAKYGEWYWKRLMDEKAEGHAQFKKFHESTYGDKFQYQDFVKDFTCELFEPDEWARVIQQSGAKYVVLTSKHHEGYTLWPSAQSWNWNAVDAGPHRDLAGDLTKAVKGKGLHMGFYYSLYEWFNPLYAANINQYVDTHMLPQMKDLVIRYQPDVLWTDGEWDHPSETWRSTEFLAWLYNESAVKDRVVVNDRWGKETRSKHGGIYTTEYDLLHEESAVGKKIEHPWEECRGIGTSFGYNRNEYLENYSSSQELVNILVDKVARGGNLLLNIGPTADGRIPVIMQQRLKDMGDWLKVNGEAIYNTRSWSKAATPQKETTVFYTTKGKNLYVICTQWPKGKLTVDGINATGKVSMLGYTGKVTAAATGGKLTITPPSVSPLTIPCQFAWTFKVENAVE